MKSIKEKSLEVFPEHCNYFTSSDNERKRIGFEAGANYVREEIENLVKTTIGDGEGYHYHLYIGLVNLLEQLKK